MSDSSHTVEISKIIINRELRQRREISTKDLEESISRIGLIQPVVVTKDLILRAGERRLQACKNLGWTEIPVHFLENLSPQEAQIVELEENLRRKDLPWQDECKAVERIHQTFCQMDPTWTQIKSEERLGIPGSVLSKQLKVAENLDNPTIAKAENWSQAYKIINRREQRESGLELQALLDVSMDFVPTISQDVVDRIVETPIGEVVGELDEILRSGEEPQKPFVMAVAKEIAKAQLLQAPPPKDVIVCGDFLEWVQTYNGPKFNFIHCDFPYGVNLGMGPKGQGLEAEEIYDDSPDVYFALLESFCGNLNKFMAFSGHLMFWFSMKHFAPTMEAFKQTDLEFHIHPLVWLKSDNKGMTTNPNLWPIHIYETCLIATRGKRQVLQRVGDAYAAPTDRSLHRSTKPEPMLRHFMRAFVDEHSMVFDPTCGSGAALRAADSLGAKTLLGLEIDPQTAATARSAFNTAHSLRQLTL